MCKYQQDLISMLKCKLASPYGSRSLSWCMNGYEEECKFKRMTHPLSAVSGRGLLRGASICEKTNLIWSIMWWSPKPQCSRLRHSFKSRGLMVLTVELYSLPSLKSRSMLVSGGPRLPNPVSAELRTPSFFFSLWGFLPPHLSFHVQ